MYTYIYIDFDDVIIDSGPIFDEIYKEKYPFARRDYYPNKRARAYSKYEILKECICEKVNHLEGSSQKKKRLLFALEQRLETVYYWYNENLRTDEMERQFNYDYFLEELNEIDYTKIISIDSQLDHSIEVIKSLINDPRLQVKIISHYINPREKICKIEFVKKYLGDIEVLLLPFYKEPFTHIEERSMNSKALFVMEKEGLTSLDKKRILIDDNFKNIDEWHRCGGRGIIFRRDGSLWDYTDRLEKMEKGTVLKVLKKTK